MGFDDTKTKLVKVKADPAATKINKLHKECCEGMRTTLQKAIEVGKLLVAQKAKCGHGKWEAWQKANLEFSQITSTRYMRCFDNKAKLSPTTDLTIEQFARFSEDGPVKVTAKEVVAELVQPGGSKAELVHVRGQEQPLKVGGRALPMMQSIKGPAEIKADKLSEAKQHLVDAFRCAIDGGLSNVEFLTLFCETIDQRVEITKWKVIMEMPPEQRAKAIQNLK